MKMLVETSGSFMLQDMQSGEVVSNSRPSVVSNSSFFASRIVIKHLNLLVPDVPDSITDDEWVTLLKTAKGDKKKAIASLRELISPPKG